jgi:ABC-type glycerol-3-phosphate transport system substrate-binding protein
MTSSRMLPALAVLIVLAVAGCPAANKTATPSSGASAKAAQPLTLIVVDDPELAKAIAREWRSRTEENLTVRDASSTEIAAASRLPGDAVIFPAGLIGQLAERSLIAPLDAAAIEGADFNYRDIFDQIRLREMKWGNRTFAMPLGSPQLLLAYRADLFEKLGLAPPTDWAEYHAILRRLADRSALGDLAPPADMTWRSAVEPLADGFAGQLLLARAAAYALHREQVSPLFRIDTMQPLIDQPPYVKALEELAAAAKASDFADQRITPQQALEELRAGRCAMALGWPAPEVGSGSEKGQESPRKIAFALLPGAVQAYRFATRRWDERGGDESPQMPLLSISGRMAGVSSSAPDPRRAQGFVVWLAGREVSEQMSPHSPATTLFRSAQIASSRRWTGTFAPEASRQYAETLAMALNLPRAFPGLTLPGRLDYLAALDDAVQQAVEGNKSAREALAEVASRWSEITERLGTDAQRQANVRSLGQDG